MAVAPPPAPSKIEKLVENAFALALASTVCGITALPAMIQSIRALVLMRQEAQKKGAFRKVVFSLMYSSCILAFVVFAVFSVIRAPRAYAEQMKCVGNLKSLSVSIIEYGLDHRDAFPGKEWCDVILANRTTNNYGLDNPKTFLCLRARGGQRSSYAFNGNLIGKSAQGYIPNDTVLLFESDVGWNAVGGPEISVARHHSNIYVSFVDGSVRWVKLEEINALRWNPFTNAPAVSR